MFSYGANIRNPSVFHNREGLNTNLNTLSRYHITHGTNPIQIYAIKSSSQNFLEIFFERWYKKFFIFFENLIDGMKEVHSLITTPRIPWRIGWYPPGSSVSAG